MRPDSPDVAVIGAGVCGLSAALALLQAGLTVTVYAAEPPHRTTSAAAGALWGPHLVGEDERVGRWAAVTLRWFRALRGEPAAGVSEIGGLVTSSAPADDEPPAFARARVRPAGATPPSFLPVTPLAGGTPRR